MAKEDGPVQLEVHIESRDEGTISAIESALQPVDVKRWPTARMDPVTVLAIAAATVKLITALLELKQKLAKRPNPPAVKVVNEAGAMLNVTTATEAALQEFLKAAK